MHKKDGRRRVAPRIFDTSGSPAEDLTGQKFGLLTVTGWAGRSDVNVSTRRRQFVNFWLCECECKDPDYNPITTDTRCLRSGNTSSCGCKRRKHLMTGTKVYITWSSMIGRCLNPKNDDYLNYGGRGVTVCDRWKESFESFYGDMGDPPDGCTLDRIDNSLGYSPENCRWATRKQQNRNRRDNRWITWNGETRLLVSWGEDPRLSSKGITAAYLARRLHSGWDLERAMTQPADNRVTFNGETLTMMEWSKRLGVREGNNIVSKRLRYGWTLEDAVTIPPGERPRRERQSEPTVDRLSDLLES
jgi:hypothetical protein